MGLVTQVKKLLKATVQNLVILILLHASLSFGSAPGKAMDPMQQEEYCRNFTSGNKAKQEIYSPSYPHNYPAGINCERKLEASYGYFVRVDFRDYFHIEPPSNEGNCDYDYLEIRDGGEGYSSLISKYCGSDFPPIITSSGPSLWLRFVSDGTIEYEGFKIVYSFIPNPLETLPFLPKCTFEVGGVQSFIGSTNISEEHLNYAKKYREPVDCTWIVRAEQGKHIYVKFFNFELKEPNDCNSNFVQIFKEKPDMEHLERRFCGSIAENFVSKTDILYFRFFATSIGIQSEFVALFTEMRQIDVKSGQECKKESEFDCDDEYCIDKSLVCNDKVRNCQHGWDEESCPGDNVDIGLDLTAPHVIIIMLLLFLIMAGMCAGLVYNLHRKLTEDKDDILASREETLASLAASAASLDDIPSPTKSRASRATEDMNGCYVPAPPDGGFPFASKN